MENENLENEVPAPKVERVSLKTIQSEKNKEQEEEYRKKFDKFLEAYKALTPEEKEMFLNSK